MPMIFVRPSANYGQPNFVFSTIGLLFPSISEKAMKMKLFLAAALAAALAFTSISDPFFTELSRRFEQYWSSLPPKIYLQPDRTWYRPGEDVWFKAWVREARSLALIPENETLFVELLDPHGTILQRRVLEIEEGSSSGDFTLPPEVAGGIYKIKAYMPGAGGRRNRFRGRSPSSNRFCRGSGWSWDSSAKPSAPVTKSSPASTCIHWTISRSFRTGVSYRCGRGTDPVPEKSEHPPERLFFAGAGKQLAGRNSGIYPFRPGRRCLCGMACLCPSRSQAKGDHKKQ
jgi:hypothetical protein